MRGRFIAAVGRAFLSRVRTRSRSSSECRVDHGRRQECHPPGSIGVCYSRRRTRPQPKVLVLIDSSARSDSAKVNGGSSVAIALTHGCDEAGRQMARLFVWYSSSMSVSV